MKETIENLLYDFITENGIATEGEISLVTNINGWNEESLNDIIYARTEYHDAEQCLQCEPDNFSASDDLLDYYGMADRIGDEDEDEDEDEE